MFSYSLLYIHIAVDFLVLIYFDILVHSEEANQSVNVQTGIKPNFHMFLFRN